MLVQKLKGRLARLLARRRRQTWVVKFARLCRELSDGYENLNFDLHSNGELRVLQKLAACDIRCVFDVGANVGDWTLEAARCLPGAVIHAFEVHPETGKTLESRTRDVSNVRAHGFGLSNRDGTLTLRYFPANSEWTSSVAYDRAGESASFEANVRRADTFAAEWGIARIDLLKIDVEGAEPDVLDGCAELLRRQVVTAIQFEYGRPNLVTRVFLQDFYRRLEAHGFVVGKIYPTYVDFRPFQAADEDFIGPNYLAVLSTRSDVIAALRA